MSVRRCNSPGRGFAHEGTTTATGDDVIAALVSATREHPGANVMLWLPRPRHAEAVAALAGIACRLGGRLVAFEPRTSTPAQHPRAHAAAGRVQRTVVASSLDDVVAAGLGSGDILVVDGEQVQQRNAWFLVQKLVLEGREGPLRDTGLVLIGDRCEPLQATAARLVHLEVDAAEPLLDGRTGAAILGVSLLQARRLRRRALRGAQLHDRGWLGVQRAGVDWLAERYDRDDHENPAFAHLGRHTRATYPSVLRAAAVAEAGARLGADTQRLVRGCIGGYHAAGVGSRLEPVLPRSGRSVG